MMTEIKPYTIAYCPVHNLTIIPDTSEFSCIPTARCGHVVWNLKQFNNYEEIVEWLKNMRHADYQKRIVDWSFFKGRFNVSLSIWGYHGGIK